MGKGQIEAQLAKWKEEIEKYSRIARECSGSASVKAYSLVETLERMVDYYENSDFR